MKVLLIAFFSLLCFIKADAQTATKSYGKIAVTITKEKKRKGIIECKVVIQQAFSGGDSSWIAQIEKSINHELISLGKFKNGTYLVLMHFVIDKEGYLSDIKPLSSVGFGMEETVMKVLKKGSQMWEPALQQGRQVKPYRTSIITMPLSNDES